MLLSKTKLAGEGAGTAGSDRLARPRPMSSPGAALNWQAIITALLFISFLVLYLATKTANYTFDAVSYAEQIVTFTKTGERHWLFHPHHLLFNLTGYLLWRIAGALGYHGGPLPVLQDMNSFLGAAGVALLWLALRKILTRSRGLAAVLSIGLGLSFGFWVCATDGRVNMPSIFLLIASFYALVNAMQGPGRRRAVAAGAIAGLATLYHESAGLFLIAGWTGIALADYTQGRTSEERRARWATLGYYTLGWAVIFVLPYLFVGTLLLHLTSIGAYKHWAAEYAEIGWWWDFHVAQNLRLDVYALRRALFVEPAGKQGTFHIAPGSASAGRILYFLSLGGWLIAVYLCAVAFPLLFKTHYRPYLIVASVWALVCAIFFTFWNPGYFVFWVPQVVACAVLVAICASYYRARRHGSAWLVAITLWIACYGISNLLLSIAPGMAASNNHLLIQAHDIRVHSRQGDLIVMSGMPWDAEAEVYVPYFGQREVFSVNTEMERHKENKASTQEALQQQILQTYGSGHTVYALDDLWHSREARSLLAERHHLEAADLAAFFAPDERTLAWRDPEGRPVWKLTPIPPLKFAGGNKSG